MPCSDDLHEGLRLPKNMKAGSLARFLAEDGVANRTRPVIFQMAFRQMYILLISETPLES